MIGRIMIEHRTSGFKLAVVLSTLPGGRARVCVWSANKRRWSTPMSVHQSLLEPVAWESLSLRYQRAVTDALKDIEHNGEVRYKHGARNVGKPWLHPAVDKQTAEGVTKLTTINFSLGDQ